MVNRMVGMSAFLGWVVLWLLGATPLQGQRRSTDHVWEGVRVGSAISLQELEANVRLSWRVEGSLDIDPVRIGAYTSKLLDNQSLDPRVNTRFGGFFARYEQDVFPFLKVYGGGRLGWGRMTFFDSALPGDPDTFDDGLRVQAIEFGMHIRLGDSPLVLESGGMFEWLQGDALRPETNRWKATTLVAYIGVHVDIWRYEPDKSQPDN